MTNQSPDLRRLRALFALEKMPESLQSEMLADGTIASSLDILVRRPIRLTPTTMILRDDLFSAFRAVADGESISPMKGENGLAVDAKISIDESHHGVVELDRHRCRFPYAALLCSDPAKRREILRTCLTERTLAQRDADWLQDAVLHADFSYDDFVEVVALLSSSPESFAERLRERIKSGQVRREDLLPDDERHWEHLVGRREDSASLADFVNHELSREREARLKEASSRAFLSISLSFSSLALVPVAVFRHLESDAVIALIEKALQVDDHFTLEGAFEICADRVPRDRRFLRLGEQLLDRLFADMNRLAMICNVFTAAFVIAASHLAEHETLCRQPVYWRRLAAAAHASLVARECSITQIDPEGLVSWAMGFSSVPYVLSVLLDMAVEPRWRPEWILSEYLVADVFGRARDTFYRIPQGVAPENWKQRLDAVSEWISKRGTQHLAILPSVLEGARRPEPPTTDELGPAMDLFRKFDLDPSCENLVSLAPVIQALGIPPGAIQSVRAAVERIRQMPTGIDDRGIQSAVSVAAHIAVLLADVPLANEVADLCIEKSPATTERHSVFEVVFRLVECAAADPDRAAARRTLSRQLEKLAYILPMSERMDDLVEALQALRRVDAELSPLLGRALATAMLGAGHSRAHLPSMT